MCIRDSIALLDGALRDLAHLRARAAAATLAAHLHQHSHGGIGARIVLGRHEGDDLGDFVEARGAELLAKVPRKVGDLALPEAAILAVEPAVSGGWKVLRVCHVDLRSSVTGPSRFSHASSALENPHRPQHCD